MALRQINACLGLYEIQAKRTAWQLDPFYFRIHGKEAWCWRRHGHTTALLSQTSGAPPGCLQCCCSQVSRCRWAGWLLPLGHTQMEDVVDHDHLRKIPHSVSHLPLEMRQIVKGHTHNSFRHNFPAFINTTREAEYWIILFCTTIKKGAWDEGQTKTFRRLYMTAFQHTHYSQKVDQ